VSTVTIVPRKNVLVTSWSQTGTDHWSSVSADDADYIYTTSTSTIYALFKLTLPRVGGAAINSVKVTALLRGTSAEGGPALQVEGINYQGTSRVLDGTWTNYDDTWTTNPKTGKAWTWIEISGLIAGVFGKKVSTTSFQCDYIKIDVNYNSGNYYESTLRPNAAGDNTEWVASAGSNYQCVDEDPISTSDYVSTTGLSGNPKDLYNLGTAAIGNNIYFVALFATFAEFGAGSNAMSLIIKTGGTETKTENISFDGTTYKEYYDVWALNPVTGLPWTQSDIDSLQAGFRSETFTVNQRCAQLYVLVGYGDGAIIPITMHHRATQGMS
jgi:hypothetical protein